MAGRRPRGAAPPADASSGTAYTGRREQRRCGQGGTITNDQPGEEKPMDVRCVRTQCGTTCCARKHKQAQQQLSDMDEGRQNKTGTPDGDGLLRLHVIVLVHAAHAHVQRTHAGA